MRTLTIILLFFMLMGIIWWLLAEWGKRVSEQALTYDRIYNSIKLAIENDTVNNTNYKCIKKRLECLSELPYKNEETTTILRNQFLEKYAEYHQADEHSPESIFVGE